MNILHSSYELDNQGVSVTNRYFIIHDDKFVIIDHLIQADLIGFDDIEFSNRAYLIPINEAMYESQCLQNLCNNQLPDCVLALLLS